MVRISIEIFFILDNNFGIYWLIYWGFVGDIVGYFLFLFFWNMVVEGLMECCSILFVFCRRVFDYDISII